MYIYKKIGLTIIFVGTYLVAKHRQEKKEIQNKKDKADVPRRVYIYTYVGTYLRQATSRPDFSSHLYLRYLGKVPVY